MRKSLLVFLWIVSVHLQGGDVSPDTDLVTGRLPNGFTYYIKKNHLPEKKASLRLVVRAGAVHEEENQRGLAHFLEHMVFRGSKHFADREVIGYLESIGAAFGPDTNAYTTYEYTCYKLEVPLNSEEALDKGVLILSDFAFAAQLDQGCLDKEKTVVLDEMEISKKSVAGRCSEAFIKDYLKGSRYAERVPIVGSESIIKACTSEDLRAFYRKWYRPDRMALIAVGDFSVEEVRLAIETYFGSEPLREEGVEDPQLEIPSRGPEVFLFYDQELSINVGSLGEVKKVSCKGEEKEEIIQKNIIKSLMVDQLNERLGKLAESPDAPFLAASFSAFNISQSCLFRGFEFIPFANKPLEGLKGVYTEILRMKKYGFSQEEFERSIKGVRECVEKALENLDRVEHEYYVNECLYSYLDDVPVLDRKSLLETRLQVINAITYEELQTFIEEYLEASQFSVGFITPVENLLDRQEIKDYLTVLEGVEVEKRKYEYANLDIDDIKEEGEVTTLFVEPHLNYEVIELSNGVKGILQKTPLKKGEIEIELFAPGGKNLLKREEYDSGAYVVDLGTRSGLANLSGDQFTDYQSTNNMHFFFEFRDNARIVGVRGMTKYGEDMFASLSAFFTKKTFSSSAWENLVREYEEIDQYNENDPYTYFFKEAFKVFHGEDPFYEEPSYKKARLEQIEECAHKLFGDPSEFLFIIVGDFDFEEVKGWLKKYISPIQGVKIDKQIEWPSGNLLLESKEEIIYRGENPHTYNFIGYGVKGELFTKVQQALYQRRALSYLLQKRIANHLRFSAGEVYSPDLFIKFPFYPALGEINAYIIFTSTGEKGKELQQGAIQEVEKAAKEGFTKEEIEEVKKIIREGVKEQINHNRFWIDTHLCAFLDGILFDEALDYEKHIETWITQEALQALTKHLFENRPSIQMRLLPNSHSVIDEELFFFFYVL